MFSVREHKSISEKARQLAWESVQAKLSWLKERLNLAGVQLVRVKFDEDSLVSQIDELPDDPKSPQLDQLNIRVALEAAYRILN